MTDITNTMEMKNDGMEQKKEKKKKRIGNFPIYQVSGGEITANVIMCDVPLTEEETALMMKIIHAQLCQLKWVVGSHLCIYMWASKTGTHTHITTSDKQCAEKNGAIINDNRRAKQVVADLLIRNSAGPMRTIVAIPTDKATFKLSSHLRKNDVAEIIQRVLSV